MKEGSFEGLMSGLDFDSSRAAHDPNEIRQIKTPDQMPERIDVAGLPENILRSNVIESLISQNDDLMSRLSVTLRRVALLEEKISDSRTESAQFRSRYDNLKDQVLVLKEQSRILNERNRRTEELTKKDDGALSELKENIRVLEIRYAELYSTSQEKQLRLEQENQKFSGAISRYKKYRKNIRLALTSFRKELQQLRTHRAGQEQTLQDLRANISETTSYITEQSKEHKAQLAELTKAYEVEIRNLRTEIENLIEANKNLTTRSQDYEQLFNEKIRIENDLVIARRREEETQLQQAVEISDIQKTLARHRNDAKELALELSTSTQNLAAQIEKVEALEKDKNALSEQVETLQLLWRDQQTQIERVTEQKTSLQMLNQELSITINEYRREIRELKESIDAAEIKHLELKNNSQKTVAAITAAKNATSTDAPKLAVKREDLLTPEIMSKIDKVLTDLHVGR
jgi:chromosome segregation ATPase